MNRFSCPERRARTALAVTFCAAFSLVFSGCLSSSHRNDPHTIVPTFTEGAVVGRATLEMPVSIPTSSLVLVPFSLESQKGWFESNDPFVRMNRVGATSDSVGLSNHRSHSWNCEGVRWHNVLIRDMQTDTQWSLLEQRGVISWWGMFGTLPKSPTDTFVPSSIVFLATTQDTNRNNALDAGDARVAIVLHPRLGTQRLVTPSTGTVTEVAHDPLHNTLYFMVRSDTDNNGAFTFKDEQTIYYVSEQGSGESKKLVDDAAIARVRSFLK